MRSRSPTGRRNGAIGRDVSCTVGTSSTSAVCARGPRRPRAPDLSGVRPSGRIRVRGRCASTARGRRNGSFAACRGRCATAERVLEPWCVFRSATPRSWRRTEIRWRGGIRSVECPQGGGSLHGYDRRVQREWFGPMRGSRPDQGTEYCRSRVVFVSAADALPRSESWSTGAHSGPPRRVRGGAQKSDEEEGSTLHRAHDAVARCTALADPVRMVRANARVSARLGH